MIRRFITIRSAIAGSAFARLTAAETTLRCGSTGRYRALCLQSFAAMTYLFKDCVAIRGSGVRLFETEKPMTWSRR